MHWLLKAALIIFGNAFALWLAEKYVPGFVLHASNAQLIVIGLILALLNFFLKPLLTLVLGPIILLTLGLGILIVNALILYVLPLILNRIDFLQGTLIIQNIPALIISTLIVSAVNLVIHIF